MPTFQTLAAGPFEFGDIHLHGRPAAHVLDAAVRDRIGERWLEYERQAREQDGSLFNGPVAHLVEWSTAESADARGPQLHLHLAPADYKTFLVTSLRDRAWFQTHAPHAMRPALGNSILLTHGNQVLLGIRSAKVSAYAYHAHLIGGVFDRVPAGGTTRDASSLLEHIYLELREELNLAQGELAGPPRALGLFRDEFLAQPELIWQAELAINPAQVVARHTNDEHAALWVGSLADACGNPAVKLTPVAIEACRLARD